MNKKNNKKSRAGLLIGLGSIFLTLTVAGLVIVNQTERQKKRNKIDDEEFAQSLESILSESDLEAYRTDTIEDIEELYHQLSAEAQMEQASYLEEQEMLIRESTSIVWINEVWVETTEYLTSILEADMESESGSNETEQAETEVFLERIRYSSDGRQYAPYASISDWESASDEKKESYIESSVVVLEDWNQTIESICTDSLSRSSRSYILGRQLHDWCVKQGIDATEGEYLAYRSYIGQGKESFYVELNDDARTIIVCQSISHGLYWKFSFCEESREAVEKFKDNEQKDRKDETEKDKSSAKKKKS